MYRLSLIWTALRASFWFLPYTIVSVFVVSAMALTRLHPNASDLWLAAFPHLFAANAAGARDMLSTIASAMISVVGIVFSMTLVALALASSQYSSRVLRTFMRSRLTQVSIGVFAGLYVYCLIVLRSIKGQDDQLVVPVTAVSLAVLFTIAAVALLIFFIHHIALSIQASTVLSSIATETIDAINGMFPPRAVDTGKLDADDGAACGIESAGLESIAARDSGYIQSIDEEAMLRLACKHDAVIRMERGVGQFTVAGTCLLKVEAVQRLSHRSLEQLRKMIKISPYRTVEQDPAFGIRQIVDVALKALSPAINDTTTAVMCVDYLGTILASLAPRPFPSPARRLHGSLRLVAVRPDFSALVCEAFDQIRRAAAGNVAIIHRMVGTIDLIGTLVVLPARIVALSEQLGLLEELSERTIPDPADLACVRQRITRVRATLSVGSGARRAQ